MTKKTIEQVGGDLPQHFNPKVGEMYVHEDGELYIVAEISEKYALVSIHEGNYYHIANKVEDVLLNENCFTRVSEAKIEFSC